MRLVRVGVLLAQSLVMAIWHHRGLLWTKPAHLGPTFSREGPSSQLGVAQHDSTADRKQISMAWSGLAQKKGLVEKGFKSLGWNSNRIIGLSVLCCCFQQVLFYFQQNKINKGLFEFLDIGWVDKWNRVWTHKTHKEAEVPTAAIRKMWKQMNHDQ